MYRIHDLITHVITPLETAYLIYIIGIAEGFPHSETPFPGEYPAQEI